MAAATTKRGGELQIQAIPGLIAIRGRSLQTEVHAHHAVQVTFALGAPVTLDVAGTRLPYESSILEADTPHLLTSGDCLILLLDPESRAAHKLRRDCLQGADVVSQAPPLPQALSGKITGEGLTTASFGELVSLFGQPLSGAVDERVRRVLGMIEELGHSGRWEEITFRRACEAAALSESRFRHLFREATGLRWRSYLLWRRMIYALALALEGRGFTDAAYQAGFSDLAHLSRICRRMFGVAPREIRRAYRSA